MGEIKEVEFYKCYNKYIKVKYDVDKKEFDLDGKIFPDSPTQVQDVFDYIDGTDFDTDEYKLLVVQSKLQDLYPKLKMQMVEVEEWDIINNCFIGKLKILFNEIPFLSIKIHNSKYAVEELKGFYHSRFYDDIQIYFSNYDSLLDYIKSNLNYLCYKV